VKTLEASKAAANFSRVLNAVHSRHESFEIVRKGVPCAHLVPPVERGSTSHELADDIAGVELSAEDRRSFSAAIQKGRKALRPLKNPWG
jgi:antitoxin (DNA-binding transcriptional repressor) of toxin-antitoxin stability system